MKNIFIILSLFIAGSASAAAPNLPAAIPSLTVGGRVFTDTTNLIQAVCFVTGTTNPNCTFRKMSGSAGYTPSGSKSFRILAMKILNNSSANNSSFYVGYSTNDVGFGTTTGPTGAVYVAGQSTLLMFNTTSGISSIEYPMDFTVPNGKYPFISNGTVSSLSGFVIIYGYEQ
jgi:hypothetical protein